LPTPGLLLAVVQRDPRRPLYVAGQSQVLVEVGDDAPCFSGPAWSRSFLKVDPGCVLADQRVCPGPPDGLFATARMSPVDGWMTTIELVRRLGPPRSAPPPARSGRRSSSPRWCSPGRRPSAHLRGPTVPSALLDLHRLARRARPWSARSPPGAFHDAGQARRRFEPVIWVPVCGRPPCSRSPGMAPASASFWPLLRRGEQHGRAAISRTSGV